MAKSKVVGLLFEAWNDLDRVIAGLTLDRFHADLWSEAGRAARTSRSSSPENWVPHITLALGPQIRDKVPDIVRLLYRRDLAWNVEVNNLTVVYEDETHKELISRYDFPGATDPPPHLT